jgi:predicted nucleotidyltransferase
MGYVHMPREWEEGRIATPEGYKAALQDTREDLIEVHNEGLIEGAVIHGSNLHNEGGPGSDIDVAIVYGDRQCEAENRINNLTNKIIESHCVPLNIVSVRKKSAKKGCHELGYYYFEYLKTFCKEGVIGSPFYAIAPKISWRNPNKEIRDILSAKLKTLSDDKAELSPEYDKDRCKFLERLLRQPIFTAIDMLRIKLGEYPSKDERLLSKAECCELYKDEFPGMDTKDLFLVLGMRIIYRDFLKKGKGKPSEYIELLGEIEGIYPNARRFMERNLDYLISRGF